MKKVITIILIAVGVIAVGIGGYYAYGYFNKSDVCKIDNTPKASTKIDLVTQNVLKDIINIKINHFFTKNYTDFNTLDNDDKFYIGNFKNDDYILADKIDDNLENIFGNTVVITKTDIKCPVDNYIMYDYSGGYFQKYDQSNHPGHGGEIVKPDYINYYKFEKVGNKYIVYTNEVYMYATAFIYNTGDTDMYDSDDNSDKTAEEIFNEKYNEIKSRLNQRKYTFEIENNRYILKSFEIIK